MQNEREKEKINNMKLLELTTKQKCSFCIKIVELVKSKILDEEAYDYIEKALDLSNKWMNEQTNISYELYDLIDNEEYGFTIFQERDDDDEMMIALWNCVIDSFAFICRKAYESEGAKYYPEPIELVDDRTLVHLINSFLVCSNGSGEELDVLISEIECHEYY